MTALHQQTFFMGGASYEPEAAALFARMSPPPSGARKIVINTLIKALKDGGVWTKLDVLYLFAAHDSQAALLNWISTSYNATAVNSPTFAADRGYTGNGSTNYLNTGWKPINGVQYTQNAAHVMGWNRAATGAQDTALLGCEDAGNYGPIILPRAVGNLLYGMVNETLSTGQSNSTETGMFIADRSASGANVNLSRNASTVGTTGNATVTRNSYDMYCLAEQSAGTPSLYSTFQISAASVGANLGSTLRTAFYNAVQAYMTSVGA